MVPETGFEPAAFSLPRNCSTMLSYTGKIGAGDENRTRRAFASAWKADSTPCGLTRKRAQAPLFAGFSQA
jgi:hypothetical protein